MLESAKSDFVVTLSTPSQMGLSLPLPQLFACTSVWPVPWPEWRGFLWSQPRIWVPSSAFPTRQSWLRPPARGEQSKESKASSFISSSYLHYHFWDIKGKTINGAAGCPTFLGRERKKKQRERWRIPMEATPSYWAAMLGGSRVSPNYSCLVTSWGRRWRSIRAGTINQKRRACSQGDCRVVFKAGTWAESITVREHMLPSPKTQDMQRPRLCFRLKHLFFFF